MSSQTDRLMIEHLDKAVKLLTEENAELKERIERQAMYHDSEVAALQQALRQLRSSIDRMVRAALS